MIRVVGGMKKTIGSFFFHFVRFFFSTPTNNPFV